MLLNSYKINLDISRKGKHCTVKIKYNVEKKPQSETVDSINAVIAKIAVYSCKKCFIEQIDYTVYTDYVTWAGSHFSICASPMMTGQDLNQLR